MELFQDYNYIFYFDVVKKTGAVLAMIISWGRNKSILMALVHGFFNWLYVIYFYFVLRAEDEQNTKIS